jgi:hypothetical protein
MSLCDQVETAGSREKGRNQEKLISKQIFLLKLVKRIGIGGVY